MRARRLIPIFGPLWVLLAAPAAAHVTATGLAIVTLDGTEVDYEVSVVPAELAEPAAQTLLDAAAGDREAAGRIGEFIRAATVKRRGTLQRRLSNLALQLIPLAEFQRRQFRLRRAGRQRERGTEQQHRLSIVAEIFARVHGDFNRVFLRRTIQLPRGEALASANGCTGPLPCCRNITASNVSVHPESTTSSTNNTGPVGGLPSMANAPRRLRTC